MQNNQVELKLYQIKFVQWISILSRLIAPCLLFLSIFRQDMIMLVSCFIIFVIGHYSTSLASYESKKMKSSQTKKSYYLDFDIADYKKSVVTFIQTHFKEDVDIKFAQNSEKRIVAGLPFSVYIKDKEYVVSNKSDGVYDISLMETFKGNNTKRKTQSKIIFSEIPTQKEYKKPYENNQKTFSNNEKQKNISYVNGKQKLLKDPKKVAEEYIDNRINMNRITDFVVKSINDGKEGEVTLMLTPELLPDSYAWDAIGSIYIEKMTDIKKYSVSKKGIELTMSL